MGNDPSRSMSRRPVRVFTGHSVSQGHRTFAPYRQAKQRCGFRCTIRSMRLQQKVAVIVGAGQTPGEGLGNGRATAMRFAQEGARILAVDPDLASAEETTGLVRKEGGECVPFEADVTRE